MKAGYVTIKGSYHLPDYGDYTGYGLACHTEDNCIRIIPDISTDAAFVEAMAHRFNAGQLSPIHFLDAIIDCIL